MSSILYTFQIIFNKYFSSCSEKLLDSTNKQNILFIKAYQSMQYLP